MGKKIAELKENTSLHSTELGIHGWIWTLNSGARYMTNSEGEGLWYFNEQTADWKQIEGTCQFKMPQSRKAAQSKIYREFCGEIMEME